MKFISRMLSFVLLAMLVASSLQARESREFCVFDVVGAHGYVYQILKDYQRKAMQAGVRLRMQPFSDEDELVQAFENGRCDLMAVTDMAARQYNAFTGSISAIGAVPRYEDLRVVLHILASPRVDKHLTTPTHEILGVMPMGGAYLFVNDRDISDVEALKGKRITVFENHHDARHMIRYVGAIPVDAKITNFARLFNTGKADISYAPAAAYEVLEMFRGMGEKGGIVRFPMGQVTVQLVARKGEFEDDFIRRSRKVMSRMYSETMRITRQYESAIPEDRWIDIPPDAMKGYMEMLRNVRIDMQNSTETSGMLAAGVYDDTMMTILRKVRCYTNPGATECSSDDRE